ncbi:hypothetical protein EGQ50_01405 [Coxiella endosymbiont of Amblyomma sculptum]|nr:hypothetical protein EGQ50_01405 [Coxiella endosymbiont of Amblyomma sculptum]
MITGELLPFWLFRLNPNSLLTSLVQVFVLLKITIVVLLSQIFSCTQNSISPILIPNGAYCR